MNTFAVEQAAAAVPADAWTNVAPAEVWLTLPSPDDASATRKLLREGLCTSLRGLSDDHAEALAAMIGALSADFAKCCEYGCLDDCCRRSTKGSRGARQVIHRRAQRRPRRAAVPEVPRRHRPHATYRHADWPRHRGAQ